MDSASTIIALVSTVVGALVGAVAGRQNALSSLASVNQLLQSRIAELETREKEKDAAIVRLISKVEALEGLVTQRADIATLTARVEAVASHMGV